MSAEMISQVWPEWQVQEVLGKGSYGTVYRAVRNDNNLTSQAAIKVISVPADQSEVDSVRSQGLSEENTRTYFQGIVNDFVSEIRLMESLKGTQNIVGVEDYRVVEHTDRIGWNIFIRMELLMPFNTYIRDRQLSEAEVLKLGIDICSALEICERRKIIHRDIKPENIFINDFGYFKLGDFGIARTLENATGGMSQKGTFNYMAPEVANGRNYDVRVDIYSLGIVLYRMLNHNRLPFIENEQQLLNPNARKAAVDRRLSGESIPLPSQASPQAASVIMQAIAYSPQARFPSASAMKTALEQVKNGTYVPAAVDLDQTVAVRHAAVNVDATVGSNAGWNRQAQGQAPQVPGWQQVNHPQTPPVQPVYTPPVQNTNPPVYTPPVQNTNPPVYTHPIQNTNPPVYTPPVQNTNPPVYTHPIQNTNPPVYTPPVQNTVPPVYTPPVQNTVPPVYTPPVQNTVPPVYTPPVQNTVPPVYTPPVQNTNPPVYTSPVQTTAPRQTAGPKKLSAACILSFLLGLLPLIFIDEEDPSLFVGLCMPALMLALVGKAQCKKNHQSGVFFAFLGLALGCIWLVAGMEAMFWESSRDEDAGIIVGLILSALLVFSFSRIGRPKKQGGK